MYRRDRADARSGEPALSTQPEVEGRLLGRAARVATVFGRYSVPSRGNSSPSRSRNTTAIGFPSRVVGRSFAFEAGFIAAEGTLLGVSLALVTLYNIVTNTKAMGELVFSVPWLTLTALLVATILASLLATIGPALSATRIRPAVALRVTD